MDYRLAFLPIIGSLIGWLTNWIAIKLIFKPYNPYHIPLLKIKIQGLLPKRKLELARSIGAVIENELLPTEELLQRIEKMQLQEKIEKTLMEITEKRLVEKLRFLPMGLKQGVIGFIFDLIKKELDRYLNTFLLNIQEQVVKESNLGQIVEERIKRFEIERLEDLVLKIVSKELKHIEILGGVLGFLIGIVQALILIYF
ncbi:hypothetical protein BBF96_09955 [Anoxybacter fermentans]|uniref:DUF445 domain-containing protein n=1 Tax=Anoxybacter fermentans TaxID=1323375 RepID=A0A3Q9HQT1_9FIRM|nr:DUF445 family protein [Anoxybacter fermentans]AZR73680.1 hypothetical protein BBF96_09955 [Anoxybacter fermentans]